MNFSIGEKVVSITSGRYLKKGRIYTVRGAINCSRCDTPFVDVGLDLGPGVSNVFCSGCKTVISFTVKWFNPRFFRRLEHNSAHDELIEKFPIEEEVLDGEEKVTKPEKIKE